MKWCDPAVVSILIGAGASLVATLALAVITAWYAWSTARMLREMERHTRLLTISVAASVEAGIMQIPSPGQVSKLHNDTLAQLQWLEKEMEPLLNEILRELHKTSKIDTQST